MINRDGMTTVKWEILTDDASGARKRNQRDCHDAFRNAMHRVNKFRMACAIREGDSLWGYWGLWASPPTFKQ